MFRLRFPTRGSSLDAGGCRRQVHAGLMGVSCDECNLVAKEAKTKGTTLPCRCPKCLEDPKKGMTPP
jgi:hypothetical protein